MSLAILIFLAVFLLFVARRTWKEEKHQALQARITGEETYEASQSTIRLKSFFEYVTSTASQAGIKRTETEWLLIVIGLPVVGFLLGMVGGIGYFGAILCAGASLVVLILFLRWRKEKRMETFRFGLQDLTEYGVSIFQVAPDVENLFREIVKNSKNKVLVYECQEILREVDGLGTPALKVMQKRAKESGVSEYVLLAEMTRSAIETNSSLVTVFKDMNATIRRYYGTEKKILAKTSGMRKVGMGLAFLPFPMFMFFWGSIKPLLHGAIQIAFYVVVGIVLFGAFVLNRVVKVRV